jgi:hypothetical protein
MRWLAIFITIITIAIGDACAQQRGLTSTAPQFSSADRAVIARNELLAYLVDQNPILVRRALDALKELGDMQTRGALERPSKNPDVDRLIQTPPETFASPEAANDLFQLLKQASRSRPQPAR